MSKQREEITTHNADETIAFGKKIAGQLQSGSVLALYGDLGSGKTTFVQGLALGLGITQKVTSPTYLIVKQYETPDGGSTRMLYHADLYRLTHNTDVGETGLSEMMESPDAITVIEWPEKMENQLPEKRIAIMFEYIDEKKRKITLVNKQITK